MLESFFEDGEVDVSGLLEGVEFFELHESDGGTDFVHTAVESEAFDVVESGSFSFVEGLVITEGTCFSYFFCEFGIVGGEHPAFDGGDMFCGIEGEAPCYTECSDILFVEGSVKSESTVFDDVPIFEGSDMRDDFHIAWESEVMYGDDGFDGGVIEGFEDVGIDIS